MKSLVIAVALICGSAWAHPVVTMPVSHGPRVPKVPKIKIFRANPHRLTAIKLQGTDPYDAPDDDYIFSGSARRPRVVPIQPNSDDELSDYVQVRLAVARARAMARYRAIHS